MMKFEIIQLCEDREADFPLDLLAPGSRKLPETVTVDVFGDLVSATPDGMDYAVCKLHTISDWHNPAFALGSFLLDIQEINGKFEEVVAVYSHDKKKFGVIGFYHEKSNV